MGLRPGPREAILEAAFLLFAERPTASLGDVAERAGVGRATLHRYFSSRAELMRALAIVALEELDQAVAAKTADAMSYAEGFRLSLEATVPLASRQWFLAHEGVEADPEVAAAYAASRKDLEKEIDAAKAEGAFASEVPTAWIVQAYENLTYSAWALVQSGEATPKQAAQLAWRTLSQGVGGRQ